MIYKIVVNCSRHIICSKKKTGCKQVRRKKWILILNFGARMSLFYNSNTHPVILSKTRIPRMKCKNTCTFPYWKSKAYKNSHVNTWALKYYVNRQQVEKLQNPRGKSKFSVPERMERRIYRRIINSFLYLKSLPIILRAF